MDDLPFLDLNAPTFSTRSEAVRAARAAHWCARTPYGVAVLRYRQAGKILRDRRFRQGSFAWPKTIGLRGSFADFWSRSIIALEGAPHKALRHVAQSALSEAFILSLCPQFEANAEQLLAPHLEPVLFNQKQGPFKFAFEAKPRGSEFEFNLTKHALAGAGFDFVTGFSEPFAGRAITALLRLPDSEAPTLARDASTLGLAMGLNAKAFEAEVNAACSRLLALADRLIDRALSGQDQDSFVARALSALCAAGPLDRVALKDLIVISIFGGVDTTRAQLAFAVALFIEHPDQWRMLCDMPDLIPQAVEEVVRTWPTTTWSTRYATEDVEMDGTLLPAGTTVHIFVHASATDPSSAPWQGFDISVKRRAHFGFGGGAHHCLGQFVARTDMACALKVLTRHVTRFEWAGTPEYLPDSGNTSPVSLPIRLIR